MHIVHESLGFDGQDEEMMTTEVFFMDHEEKARAGLEASMRNLMVPYDCEVFPERLVLLGFYNYRNVSKLITYETRPRVSNKHVVNAYRPRENFIPNEKYL